MGKCVKCAILKEKLRKIKAELDEAKEDEGKTRCGYCTMLCRDVRVDELRWTAKCCQCRGASELFLCGICAARNECVAGDLV